jgi:precorrin-2 dehydrogenase/sirohydrochlorin ferrochelatase
MKKNELYPIFLKVSQLNVLIVGGGNVALEKLTFLLKSSPNAKVQIVAPELTGEILELCEMHKVKILKHYYSIKHLNNKQIVIAATNDQSVNHQIYKDAKTRNILINVADSPKYCDFYLGGIVSKGNVKIAISTNGQSPTVAKRLRQFLEEIIPENIDDLVNNLNTYRDKYKNDFSKKVSNLNQLTKNLINLKTDRKIYRN